MKFKLIIEGPLGTLNDILEMAKEYGCEVPDIQVETSASKRKRRTSKPRTQLDGNTIVEVKTKYSGRPNTAQHRDYEVLSAYAKQRKGKMTYRQVLHLLRSHYETADGACKARHNLFRLGYLRVPA